jgi:3,4-dihydroxy 2-butanone 4-phosphate synthase / GTP cyclohydrolase II
MAASTDSLDGLAPIEEVAAELRRGRMVVIVDDEDRENEGDLVIAAESANAEAINFMTRFGRGLICLALSPERCDELELTVVAGVGTDAMGTAFTVAIDAVDNPGTGISADERAHTIAVAIDPRSRAEDLHHYGHVFPLRAKEGGVLRRAGHTEAGVDLARVAGLYPAAVICEILREDGEVARLPDLREFCREHDLKLTSVADLIALRRTTERIVEAEGRTMLPTDFGRFSVVTYRSVIDDGYHLALVKGDVEDRQDVLVRVHSECLTGDVFHSRRCDCGQQLEAALRAIEAEGCGVLLYLAQEGRGIGLSNKLRAYRLQERGFDTVDANLELGMPVDLRDYGVGAEILADLGLSSIRLLTNNPKKIASLEGHGLTISAQIPLPVVPNADNRRYLETKMTRLGHTIHEPETSSG